MIPLSSASGVERQDPATYACTVDVGKPGPEAVAAIDVTAQPSGTGCVECEAEGGWWLHLRRCAACGHIGCCETSPSRHARAHAAKAGHPVVRSFEPGELWFWDYTRERYVPGPELAPPASRPESQPSPGPAGRVPPDWRDHLRPSPDPERQPNKR
jgi:Zn-finger in ubiquitin-hydrolases and other protein